MDIDQKQNEIQEFLDKTFKFENYKTSIKWDTIKFKVSVSEEQQNTTGSLQYIYIMFEYSDKKELSLSFNSKVIKGSSAKAQKNIVKLINNAYSVLNTFDNNLYDKMIEEYRELIKKDNEQNHIEYNKFIEEKKSFVPDIDLCYVYNDTTFFRVIDNSDGNITFEKYTMNLTSTEYIPNGVIKRTVSDFNVLFDSFKKVTYNDLVCSNN